MCFLWLEILDPYVEYGIVRAIMFVNNMGPESLTSIFLTYTLQLIQIESGQTEIVLLQNYNKLNNLATDLWIK